MNVTSLNLVFHYLEIKELQIVRLVNHFWHHVARRTIMQKIDQNPWMMLKTIYQSGWNRVYKATNKIVETTLYTQFEWAYCELCWLPIYIGSIKTSREKLAKVNNGYPWCLNTCIGKIGLCSECSVSWTCVLCKTHRNRPTSRQEINHYFNEFCKK